MRDDPKLAWEARWARPAAGAAFAAAVALLVQIVLLQSLLEDRPGVRALPDFLLSVDERTGQFLGAYIAQAVGVLLMVPAFLYLFRATLHREGVASWFAYVIYVGPALFAVAALLGALERIDFADQFASGEPIRGEPGDDRADRISDDPNLALFALSFVGLLGMAFLFVMLPLRARRVGLLSGFMGILAVVVGALIVLQIVPLVPTILQSFWLGALGLLYLGNWPGGRGPAWDSGRSAPWPTAAQRRGLARRGEGSADAEAERPDEGEAERPAPAATNGGPEPEPEAPGPRRRKRKRR